MSTGNQGQVTRIAKRFAFVAAAGELATSLGITGWDDGDATKGLHICFSDWLDSRGSTHNQEEIQAIEQVKSYIEEHGESRFTNATMPNGKTINRSGLRYQIDGCYEYFIFSGQWAKICKGLDKKKVSEVLMKIGAIVPTSNGCASKTKKYQGQSFRGYYIKPNLLDVELLSDKGKSCSPERRLEVLNGSGKVNFGELGLT